MLGRACWTRTPKANATLRIDRVGYTGARSEAEPQVLVLAQGREIFVDLLPVRVLGIEFLVQAHCLFVCALHDFFGKRQPRSTADLEPRFRRLAPAPLRLRTSTGLHETRGVQSALFASTLNSGPWFEHEPAAQDHGQGGQGATGQKEVGRWVPVNHFGVLDTSRSQTCNPASTVQRKEIAMGLSPDAILQLSSGAWASKTLPGAVEAGAATALGDGSSCANPPDTALCLGPTKPAYIGGLLEMVDTRLHGCWVARTDTLKSGQPQDEIGQGENFFGAFVSIHCVCRGLLLPCAGRAGLRGDH